MAANIGENRSLVRISEDGLKAYLSLCPPQEGVFYQIDDLVAILKNHNVTEGVKVDVLETMIKKADYMKEYLVAEGVPAVDGKDGRYHFFFSIPQDNKPKILPDGTVDYGSMSDVESVEAGKEIVRYIKAENGINGLDVSGHSLFAKSGKDLPVLKGKGFTLSEDKLVYTAAVTGKVEYTNDRLVVSNMITIDGDVNIITGNIQFTGDVLVRGNVVTGMVIDAKGSITVNGHVEGADLIAGKDVILKNGMQGAGRGEIRANGDVSGKFFEQTTIYAKGSIKANAILNCYIISEQEIIVSGKKGIIVGGTTCAIKKIEATIIGNMSEAKTVIELGVDAEGYAHLQKVKSKYETVLSEVQKLEQGIRSLNAVLEKKNKPDLAQKKLDLVRIKVSKDTQLTGLQTELKNMKAKIMNSQGARLVVRKSIYRGTKLTINGVQKILESENYNVTYLRNGAEIEFKLNI